MDTNKTIDEYRATKAAMELVIDRHMAAAFAELKREFGTTPTYVGIDLAESRTMQDKYPEGVYRGCSVGLAGE